MAATRKVEVSSARGGCCDDAVRPAEGTLALISVLTCPACGAEAEEAMPEDACQFFYECRGCKVLLRPKPGDCCVFCSYGSVTCPPVQAEGKGCC